MHFGLLYFLLKVFEFEINSCFSLLSFGFLKLHMCLISSLPAPKFSDTRILEFRVYILEFNIGPKLTQPPFPFLTPPTP